MYYGAESMHTDFKKDYILITLYESWLQDQAFVKS